MKKHSIIPYLTHGILLICLLALNPAWATPLSKDPLAHKVGDQVTVENARFTIVGMGGDRFEYIATGESLELAIDGATGMTIVPRKGQKVVVDSSVPGVWVDGKLHYPFEPGSWLARNRKGNHYILMEFDRNYNAAGIPR